MRSILSLLLLAGLATPALAVDGVLEINRTCAVQTGCFSGDVPGFPVTIDGSAGGSYRLTSSLVVGNGSVIDVDTSRVSIDLNGFSIRCEPAANCFLVVGSGINGANADDVTVRNGMISEMAGNGITLGDRARIQNMRITNNGGYGVSMRGSSLLIHSTIRGNSLSGVRTFDEGSLIIDNVINDNGGHGISGSGGTSYKGNLLTGNNGVSETQVNPGSATEIDGNYCGSDTICP
jgi:hypothetical protein